MHTSRTFNMEKKGDDRRRLRPVDLARERGLSTQAVRNYEAEGILPQAERTPFGYRVYTRLHAQALHAFAALVPAHGHQAATAIMRAVNRRDVGQALALVDESHGQLLRDRQTLSTVERGLSTLGRAAPSGPPGSVPILVGPLARQLRVRPATLRKWEWAGLLQPRRDPETGYRIYTPADVRDAHLAHQLRRGIPAEPDRPAAGSGPGGRRGGGPPGCPARVARPAGRAGPSDADGRRRARRLPRLDLCLLGSPDAGADASS